jgi:hypothetical protein
MQPEVRCLRLLFLENEMNLIKKASEALVVALSLLSALPARAVPSTLFHQGRILDNAGEPLTGSHELTFSLYDAATSGTTVWTETLTADFDDGFYGVRLGGETNLVTVLTGGGPFFLSLAVDGGEPFMPRQEISSVPYALEAGGLTVATSIDVAALSVDGVEVITDASDVLGGLACTAQQLAKFNGTTWVCAEDMDTTIPDTNTQLDETAVEGFVTNDALDLNGSTTLGGGTIVNISDPSVSCADGDVVAYDAFAPGWLCASSAGESDPVYSASVAAAIDTTDVSNWNTAFGWNDHASAGYITASSTDTLSNKSGNISMWTNDTGYITDGNSDWDNSYGFITAASTDALTNKSGNISMWTNDAGYLDAEADTLASVTGRGSSTADEVTFSGGARFPGNGNWNNQGRVGIGTTSPTYPLDVRRSSAGQIAGFQSSGAYGYLRFSEGTTSRGTIGYGNAGDILSGAASNSLAVYASNALHLTASSTAADGITVTSSGTVGVGTTSPAAKVELSGTGTTTRLYLTDYTSSYPSGAMVALRKARGTTSAPSAVLANDRLAEFQGAGYHGSGFSFGAHMNMEATENWSSSARGTAITFYTVSNGTAYSNERMRIHHNGDVGIGRTPSYKLDVAGDVRVGTGSYGCVRDGNGDVIAGTCSSDARLKQDIRPLESTLERLTEIVPVRYRWRQVRDGESIEDDHLGLIAQNVEQSLPALVHVDEQGHKRVDYSALPILTLQAVREQQQIIESLEEVVQAQQIRLDAYAALDQRLVEQETRIARVTRLLEQTKTAHCKRTSAGSRATP